MTYNPEPEIKAYLKRLSKAAHNLPRARRRELVSEIEQHIRERLIEKTVDNRAETLTLLDRLGDPDEIAAAASGQSEATRSTTMETWAIILLLLGGFVFLVGWFAGVVLLWSSNLRTLRDKLIGTFVIPGGLATAFLVFSLAGSAHRPSTLGVIGGSVGLALMVIGPIATSIYLGRRLNKQKHARLGDTSAAIG
jgi:uncharacterized membrane protein